MSGHGNPFAHGPGKTGLNLGTIRAGAVERLSLPRRSRADTQLDDSAVSLDVLQPGVRQPDHRQPAFDRAARRAGPNGRADQRGRARQPAVLRRPRGRTRWQLRVQDQRCGQDLRLRRRLRQARRDGRRSFEGEPHPRRSGPECRGRPALGVTIGDKVTVSLPDGSSFDVTVSGIADLVAARSLFSSRRGGDLETFIYTPNSIVVSPQTFADVVLPAFERAATTGAAGSRARRYARSTSRWTASCSRRSGHRPRSDPADRSGDQRRRRPPGLPAGQHLQHPRRRHRGRVRRQAALRLPRAYPAGCSPPCSRPTPAASSPRRNGVSRQRCGSAAPAGDICCVCSRCGRRCSPHRVRRRPRLGYVAAVGDPRPGSRWTAPALPASPRSALIGTLGGFLATGTRPLRHRTALDRARDQRGPSTAAGAHRCGAGPARPDRPRRRGRRHRVAAAHACVRRRAGLGLLRSAVELNLALLVLPVAVWIAGSLLAARAGRDTCCPAPSRDRSGPVGPSARRASTGSASGGGRGPIGNGAVVVVPHRRPRHQPRRRSPPPTTPPRPTTPATPTAPTSGSPRARRPIDTYGRRGRRPVPDRRGRRHHTGRSTGVSNVILRSARTSDPPTSRPSNPARYARSHRSTDAQFASGDGRLSARRAPDGPDGDPAERGHGGLPQGERRRHALRAARPGHPPQVEVGAAHRRPLRTTPGFPDGADAVMASTCTSATVPDEAPGLLPGRHRRQR